MNSTDVGNPFVGFDLRRCNRLRRKLEHRCFLTFPQISQQHHLPVGKFQRIMMRGGLSILTCRKMAVVCLTTFGLQLNNPPRALHLTELAKASSVPGRTQTAILVSSGAANTIARIDIGRVPPLPARSCNLPG